MKYLRVDNYIIETPLIDIIRRLQIVLTNGKLKDVKESATDIAVTCPNDAHSGGREHHPDCRINIDETNTSVPYGYFHCFACQVSGTFVKFVAHCFSSSEDFAKHWLIEHYGTATEEKILIDDFIDINKAHKKSRQLDESILDQYQTWTPYLAKRGLSREMCTNFKVRYDPKYRQVIFPIYDMRGRLKMLAKRNIDTKVFYMDKDQEKEVYGLNIIQKNNISNCIITEGPFDMLTGWTHGIPTIATLGTISNYQIEQINKSCIKVLYLAFDNDTAGERFASILKAKLDKRILVIDINLPKHRKDLNDLSQEEWQAIINNYFIFE